MLAAARSLTPSRPQRTVRPEPMQQGTTPIGHAGLSNRWMLGLARTLGMAVGTGMRRFVKRLRRNRVDFKEAGTHVHPNWDPSGLYYDKKNSEREKILDSTTLHSERYCAMAFARSLGCTHGVPAIRASLTRLTSLTL
jgi:hypothetical protein